jgi:hypothetical protein
LLDAVLVVLRLGGFAKADLVGGDDAVAGFNQGGDGGLPGGGADILAVQQDGGLAVRVVRLDVHVGHVERRGLGGEAEMRDGPGVVEALQVRAVGQFVRCGRLREEDGCGECELRLRAKQAHDRPFIIRDSQRFGG